MLRRNVILFHQGALGDWVCAWPIVLGAARAMPQARTVVVTSAGKGALATKLLGVEARDAERWHPLFGDPAGLDDAQRKLLAGAALVVSFVSDGSDAWAANARAAAGDGARFAFIAPRPPEGFAGHVVDWQLGQLGDEHVLLRASARSMAAHLAANGLTGWQGGGPVLVHPGAGSRAKLWPAARWAAVIDALKADGRAVKLLLGEAERELLTRDEAALLTARAEVAETPTLVDLAAALRSASAFVGHDTGPTHLAAALGVPTVAAYRAANVARWGPRGPRVSVASGEALGDVAVDDVLERVRGASGASAAPARTDDEDE